jgi:hypothetical protein
MDHIDIEIGRVDAITRELESRGPYIERTHYCDGITGFTACDQGTLAMDEDITGDWTEVTCVECLINE